MRNPRTLRTVREAADELSLSEHTIRSWLAQRKLSYTRLGRAIRIPQEEIQRLREGGWVPARRHVGETR